MGNYSMGRVLPQHGQLLLREAAAIAWSVAAWVGRCHSMYSCNMVRQLP
jgi:hypothetical protein